MAKYFHLPQSNPMGDQISCFPVDSLNLCFHTPYDWFTISPVMICEILVHIIP